MRRGEVVQQPFEIVRVGPDNDVHLCKPIPCLIADIHDALLADQVICPVDRLAVDDLEGFPGNVRAIAGAGFRGSMPP